MPIRKELATITDLETNARAVPVGSYVYRQGDVCPACCIVLNGWIALSVLLDDGSCQILDFAFPGAVLGFQSGPQAPIYHSAQCLSAVRVYIFPRRKLDAILEANPRLAFLLCRQIRADEARAHDHLINLALRSSRERIARFLLETYVRLRRRLPSQPGETVLLPLNQGHIGQTLGLTNVHVCRTLHILREQKIVRFANHRLEIIDPAALIAAGGIEAEVTDCRHRVPLGASVYSLTDRQVTASLPAGWMPIENNPPDRMPLAPSRLAA
jgi:CRP/FNR family transcriptional regulator, anaerobic regulatory protein